MREHVGGGGRGNHLKRTGGREQGLGMGRGDGGWMGHVPVPDVRRIGRRQEPMRLACWWHGMFMSVQIRSSRL